MHKCNCRQCTNVIDVGHGLLKREAVRGHANYWIVLDVYQQTHATDCTTVKDSFRNKNNALGNAISSRSIGNFPLVKKILSITGDKKSTRYWIGIVRKLPEDEILQCLSHLRIAMSEKIVRSPGAYLNSLIIANHPEMRRSEPTQQQQEIPAPRPYVEESEGEPASPEVAKAAIAEIMARLNRKAV